MEYIPNVTEGNTLCGKLHLFSYLGIELTFPEEGTSMKSLIIV